MFSMTVRDRRYNGHFSCYSEQSDECEADGYAQLVMSSGAETSLNIY
jgi:hypothetical protein